MKILVEDTKLGIYEKDVPDNYFDRVEAEIVPTIEERLSKIELENISLKSQLTELSKDISLTQEATK